MTAASDLSALGRAALAYAALGWRVFTLYPRDKKPMTLCAGCLTRLPGKNTDTGIATCKSCGRAHHDGRDGTPHELGLYVATTDSELITRWWLKEPKANIGVRCGDGLMVVDCDVPAEGKVADGEASLAALEQRHGALPTTPRQRTGEHKQPDGTLRRGAQYAFAVDEAVKNSASKIGPGIDVRGDGGFVVVAPSVHPSGAKYEWDADRKPSKLARAPCPSWLLNLAKGERKLSEVASAKGPPKDQPPRKRRPETASASERWVNGALDGEYDNIAAAPKGTRNQALNRGAFKLGQLVGGGCLSEQDARATLQAAAEANGWAAEEGAAAVESVIASGLAAGLKVPREAPQERIIPDREPYQPPNAKPKLRAVAGTTVAAIQPEPEPAEEGKPVTKKGWRIEDWQDQVEFKDAETRILAPKCTRNAIAMLLYRWETQDLFMRNKRTRRIVVTRKPMWTNNGYPYPRNFCDEDTIGCLTYMEQNSLRLQKGSVHDAIRHAAKEREFDPVMEKLTSFIWDGKPRLDHYLVELMGAEDDHYTRTVGAKWMIAAVARIMQPGCKVDQMLILEGPQNLGKSTALYLLGNALDEEAYSDRLSAIDSKDSMIEMVGRVIIELPELDVLKNCDYNKAKGFISRRFDDVRLPWDKETSRLLRGGVLAGTVNPDGLGWLNDPTGNRRYWPVTVTDIDLARLAEEAPQLWAEALVRYKAGEEWWITDPVVLDAASEAAAQRTYEDVWADKIDKYIATVPHTQVADILRELGIEVGKQDQKLERRVAHHLKRRGWVSRLKKTNARVWRAWWPPTKQDLFGEPPDDDVVPYGDPGPEER